MYYMYCGLLEVTYDMNALIIAVMIITGSHEMIEGTGARIKQSKEVPLCTDSMILCS